MTSPTSPSGRPSPVTAPTATSLRALRRLLREAPAATVSAAEERCELCGTGLLSEHRHLWEVTAQSLVCACTACTLLFEREGAGGGKYIAVPRRRLALEGFHLADEQWDDLLIPVNMAFIYTSSAARRPVAYYPGPAGATESLLSLDSWDTLVAENPILASLAPDVEALLINRLRGACDYFLVPIDACYQLVGIIRGSWRGLSGGDAVWDAIGRFFADLRARAEVVPVGADAGVKGKGEADA